MRETNIPLTMNAVLCMALALWNQWVYALAFPTSTELKTLPIGITTEPIKADVFFWGSLMGGALLGSVPVALIYSVFVDNYVAAFTAGAVKS